MAFRQRFRHAIGALSVTVLASATLGALVVGTAAAPAGATAGSDTFTISCPNNTFNAQVPGVSFDVTVNGTAPNTAFPTSAPISVDASSVNIVGDATFGAVIGGLVSQASVTTAGLTANFAASGTHVTSSPSNSQAFVAPPVNVTGGPPASYTTGSGTFTGGFTSSGVQGDVAQFAAVVSGMTVQLNANGLVGNALTWTGWR